MAELLQLLVLSHILPQEELPVIPGDTGAQKPHGLVMLKQGLFACF